LNIFNCVSVFFTIHPFVDHLLRILRLDDELNFSLTRTSVGLIISI